MEYELFSTADLNNLPADNLEAFVQLEMICRRSVAQVAARTDSEGADEIRLQYVRQISAFADVWGVPFLTYPRDNYSAYDTYIAFSREAQTQAALIIAKNRRGNLETSIHVAPRTRAAIDLQVATLRRTIEASDFSKQRKAALNARLDEFGSELSNQRAGVGKAMAILMSVAAALGNIGGIVAGVAEAPEAIANIVSLLGHDKAAEEAETLRLSAPQKAIAAPSRSGLFGDVDDDSPRWRIVDGESPF